MKKIWFGLIVLILSILFILLIYFYINRHIYTNNLENETKLNNEKEDYDTHPQNHIEWPIEFANVPKFKANAVDYIVKSEYYELYYNNILYDFLNNYIEELKLNGYSVTDENYANNGIKYSIYKDLIHMEFIWNNSGNLDLKVLLYRYIV